MHIRSKKRWPLVAAPALPLLLGVWYVRFSTASIGPGPERDYLARLGADPDRVTYEDRIALAQRAKDVTSSLVSLDSPAGARESEAQLAKDPSDARAHRALGTYYRYKSRDLPRSVRHWRETVRLEPNNGQSKWDLGFTLMRAGQRDESMRVFEQMASAKIEGSGLARKFAEEDAEIGRRWLQKIRANPKLGLLRTSQPEL